MYMTQKKRKKKEKIKKQTSKRTLLFDENSINYLTWIFVFFVFFKAEMENGSHREV